MRQLRSHFSQDHLVDSRRSKDTPPCATLERPPPFQRMAPAGEELPYVLGQSDSVYQDLLLRNVDNSAKFIKHLLGPTTSVLDCGCGPGAITRSFKEICTDGNVVGIDRDPDAIQFASKQGGDIKFVTGNIDSLPFADDTFDVVYSHQVFQFVEDPVKCMVEMRRVCKQGGVVAVRVCDHDAIFWYPAHRGISRCMELFKESNRLTGGNLVRGRKMPHFALKANFQNVTTTVSTWCAKSQKERKHWAAVWAGLFINGHLRRVCEKRGLLKENDVEDIVDGFNTYEQDEGGILVLPHVEVLCVK